MEVEGDKTLLVFRWERRPGGDGSGSVVSAGKEVSSSCHGR